MPRLRRGDLGDLDNLICRRAGCGHNVATIGNGPNSGFQLPFCPDDLKRLSRRTFNQLRAVAGRSVFDIDAVGEAAASMSNARLELSASARKAKRP